MILLCYLSYTVSPTRWIYDESTRTVDLLSATLVTSYVCVYDPLSPAFAICSVRRQVQSTCRTEKYDTIQTIHVGNLHVRISM